DPELLPRLFNAFEQGNVSGYGGGLGLGLAISRLLANAHGGSLEAHSDGTGRGARFTFRLPLATADAGAPQSPLPAEPSTAPPVRRLRILLVEDHPNTLQILQKLLSRSHDVSGAKSVAEALLAADGESFDLVISDLGLPDGSGFEVMSM